MPKKKTEPIEVEVSSEAMEFAASEAKAAREAAEAHAKADNALRVARNLRIMADLASASHRHVVDMKGIAAVMNGLHADLLREAADMIAPKPAGKWVMDPISEYPEKVVRAAYRMAE